MRASAVGQAVVPNWTCRSWIPFVRSCSIEGTCAALSNVPKPIQFASDLYGPFLRSLSLPTYPVRVRDDSSAGHLGSGRGESGLVPVQRSPTEKLANGASGVTHAGKDFLKSALCQPRQT